MHDNRYESLVDWTVKTDYLRCSPQFHRDPRYNFVIMHPPTGDLAFAQLVLVFVIQVREKDYHLVLVQPMDQPSQPQDIKEVDRALSISRWHA